MLATTTIVATAAMIVADMSEDISVETVKKRRTVFSCRSAYWG
jgi:hypothetical protein